MSARLAPGIFALLVGAGLAVLLFVPLVAISYRRNGAMTPLRTAGWLATLLWVLGLWAYVLLPLPSPDAVRCTTPQLQPLYFVGEVLRIDGSGVSLVANGALEARLFNILLFVPMGVLLRGIFGRGAVAAVAGGLALSLLVEVTQLTGIYGLYACSYRVFDVDDLIANTAGAALGWLAVWAVTRGRAIDTRPAAGTHLTLGRRLTGMAADWLVAELLALAAPSMTTLALVAGLGLPADSVAGIANLGVGTLVALLVHGLVLARTGATIGEHAVLLGNARAADGGRPGPGALAIRFGLGIGGWLVLVALPGPLDWAAALLAVAGVAGVIRDPERWGLAARAAGLRVVDRRSGMAPGR